MWRSWFDRRRDFSVIVQATSFVQSRRLLVRSVIRFSAIMSRALMVRPSMAGLTLSLLTLSRVPILDASTGSA